MNTKHRTLSLVVSAAVFLMSMPLVSSAAPTSCYVQCGSGAGGPAGDHCETKCQAAFLKANPPDGNEATCLEGCKNSNTEYEGCEADCRTHKKPGTPTPQ